MPLHPKSDLLLVSSYPPAWEELAQYTVESHAAYARAQGYDYHADCSDLYDARQGGKRIGLRGFIKFNLILRYMPEYRYVVWLDGDLIVTNPSLDMRALIDRHAGNDIIVGYDWNSFNSTVIAVRSTPVAQAFFWSCNNTGRDLFLYHGWHEMQAMKYFAEFPPYDRLVGYESCKTLAAILPEEYAGAGVPLPIMEPYRWRPGDFALHLSALPIERRIELARRYTEMAHV